MTPEQGGTGHISDATNLLGLRAGVPLQPLMNDSAHLINQSSKVGYDAEYARMEAWMDEHQEFVQDYFIRKATRQVVDAWMVSHATTAGNDCIGSPTHTSNGQNCSSRGGSGATTPVRKISAHEFERGGLLKPIVNTIDGTPTFLSVGTTQSECSANNILAGSGSTLVPNSSCGISAAGGNCGNGNGSMICSNGNSQHNHNNHHHHHHIHNNSNNHYYHQYCHHQMANGGRNCSHNFHRPQRLSRNELKQMDEKELIFELVKDICNELEVRTLCHKILQNVSILLNADRGSLFLVQGRCNGADGLKKCLVSKLFDVCPRSTVEEMVQREEVRVAWGTGIAGHVAESGEPVNIPDAYQDERFNDEIDSLTGYRTKTLLCMPIKDSSGDVIGVAQVINKLNGDPFSQADEKVFASYLQFCGIGLRNAQLYEKSQLEIKRNQVLLDLARMIFEEQSTIEHMVFRILTHMQSLIQCQRVQILLVHEASKGSFSRVFDFEANDLSKEDSVSRISPFESRFPINIGITGYVATTGETVNVPNAYEDDRFDPSVDENSNFKHKSILCMAIKNSLGQIIGVIQLINKFDDLNFTKNDENFVEAFAIFCGMGIHNTHMYEKAIVAMAKQSVTLEVLSYHASATIDEAHRLRRLRVPSAVHFRLHDFKFDDIHFEDDDTLKACLRMFLDLDFVERFHIDYEVLCRWLLSVKKNYRNVTYHNWRHAFNVAQMMFAILTATQWWKIFGEIECLALIIGCLCHDLDHRGTNNSFQIKASSPLAQLYSTSTMEHHHFDQCLMILNSPGNQILANLSSEDYCRVVRVLEDAILSTDLAVYFRKRGSFLQYVQEQPLSYWAADEPRALLRAMSMTVCDLSAITKPWEIEKRVADLVSSEFFEQGDMEKEELNITPIDIMNREKEDELPMMQVSFIESICLPIYEAFARLSNKLEPLVEGVRDNRQHWIELADEVRRQSIRKSLKDIEGRTFNVCHNCRSRCGSISTEYSSETMNGDGHSDNNSDHENCDNRENNVVVFKAFDSRDNSTYIIDVDAECPTKNKEAERQEQKGKTPEDCNKSGIDDNVDNNTEQSFNECLSSSSCSRVSTPPLSDDNCTVSNSTAKLTRLKQVATHLNNSRNCKSCEQTCRNINENIRNNNNSNKCNNNCISTLRKAYSFKGINEMFFGANYNEHMSRSTPTISTCGLTTTVATRFTNSDNERRNHQQVQVSQHYRHKHHHYHQQTYRHHNAHHHQNRQRNHLHYYHHYQHNYSHHHSQKRYNSTSNCSDSDKIPRIVGKLGNLEGMHPFGATTEQMNGLTTFISSGHFSIFTNNLLSRRHSETNGLTATRTTATICEK